MKSFEINFGDRSENSVRAIGSFIRQLYFLNKKNFKCCGISGTYSKDKNDPTSEKPITLVEPLSGNALVYDLILNINKCNTTPLNEIADFSIGQEYSLETDCSTIHITRKSEELFELQIEASGTEITTEIFGDLVDQRHPYVLFKDFTENAVKLNVYFRYGSDTYSDVQVVEMFERNGVQAYAFSVVCEFEGALTFKVDKRSFDTVLIISYDERYTAEGDIRKVCSDALKEISEIVLPS